MPHRLERCRRRNSTTVAAPTNGVPRPLPVAITLVITLLRVGSILLFPVLFALGEVEPRTHFPLLHLRIHAFIHSQSEIQTPDFKVDFQTTSFQIQLIQWPIKVGPELNKLLGFTINPGLTLICFKLPDSYCTVTVTLNRKGSSL